jgi:hypothetical protein
MSSQKNQPLPNPFETAVNTGKIGGHGKPEEQITDNAEKQQSANTGDQQTNNTKSSKTAKEEKSQTIKTDNQQPAKTAKKKSTAGEKKQPQSKAQTPAPEKPETDDSDKTKLTCTIPTDLLIRLKVHVARHKKEKETMTNVTIKALEEYLTHYPQ